MAMASQLESPEGAAQSEQGKPQKALAKRPVRTGQGTPKAIAHGGRSRLNAVKHGIFAGGVLERESLKEYRELWRRLADSLQPVGELEKILVEKLAMTLWRYRRLLRAEAAEIGNTQEQRCRSGEGRWESIVKRGPSLLEFGGGLVLQADDPVVIEKCVDLLIDLNDRIVVRGFDVERDLEILKVLYGTESKQPLHQTLLDRYCLFAGVADVPEEERKAKDLWTPEECKQLFLGEIADEIRRLKKARKPLALLAEEKDKLWELRSTVLEGDKLERFLRYEASLERAFDRALNQLERLQRMRLGHAVPPPLKVEISE